MPLLFLLDSEKLRVQLPSGISEIASLAARKFDRGIAVCKFDLILDYGKGEYLNRPTASVASIYRRYLWRFGRILHGLGLSPRWTGSWL